MDQVLWKEGPPRNRLESWLVEATQHFSRDLVEILEESRRRHENAGYDAEGEAAACAELRTRLTGIQSAFAR